MSYVLVCAELLMQHVSGSRLWGHSEALTGGQE